MVDFGGSLAVASMGLYATGVSTDLAGTRRLSGRPSAWTCPLLALAAALTGCRAVTYLSPGGRPGDRLKVTATCDKSKLGGTAEGDWAGQQLTGAC